MAERLPGPAVLLRRGQNGLLYPDGSLGVWQPSPREREILAQLEREGETWICDLVSMPDADVQWMHDAIVDLVRNLGLVAYGTTPSDDGDLLPGAWEGWSLVLTDSGRRFLQGSRAAQAMKLTTKAG